MRYLSALLPVLLVAACDILGPDACTTDFVAGVIVTVVDSISEEPLAENARGYVQEGTFVDSLAPSIAVNGILVAREAAHERPGLYEVVVSHDGYETWQASSVRVRDRDCHVRTARLTARLREIPK